LPIEDAETISLPGEFSNACTDSSGKYIFLLMDKLFKIAVFDTQAKKISSFIPIPEDATMAVNADSLFVASSETNTIKRFTFPDFKLTLDKRMDKDEFGKLLSIGIGTGPACPMIALFKQNDKKIDISFLDPVSLAKYEVEYSGQIPSFVENSKYVISASPDGSNFYITLLPRTFTYPFIVKLTDNTAKIEGNKGISELPSFSPSGVGKYLFCGNTILTNNLEPVPFVPTPPAFPYYLPSLQEVFYMGVVPVSSGNKQMLKISVFNVDLDFPIFTVEVPAFRDNVAFLKTIFYLPDTGYLITAGSDMKSLKLRNVDLKKELDEKGGDYLLVLSDPPRVLDDRKQLNYKIKCLSNIKNIKYEPVSVPQGMEISGDGNVTWKCPDNYLSSKETVIISVSGNDRKIFHSFVLDMPKGRKASRKVQDEMTLSVKDFKLPAEPANLTVGGGGRYILLYIKTLNKIAVFDFKEKDIVKYINVPYNDLVMAASADKLAVAEKLSKKISVFHLGKNDFQLIHETALPIQGLIKDIGLGYDS
jgi:hypothetical protein